MVDEFEKGEFMNFQSTRQQCCEDYEKFVHIFAEENGFILDGYISGAGWITTSIVFKSKDDELMFRLKYNVR